MYCRRISKISPVFVLLFAVSLSASAALAQPSPCSLKFDQLANSTELRGFRLGMNFEQVKARVPQVEFGPADQFGVTKTSINPYFDPRIDKAAFADVRTISFDFLDGKLVSLWIGFERTFKWQPLDEFVSGMSKSLNLPAAWPPKRTGRELSCDGFSVSASIIAGSPSIRILDEPAQEIIAARREEAAAAEEAMVIGDQRTKLYYPSDCEAREKVPEARRVTFKNKAEAESAGYKRAQDCED
jgi:hypothetical protein